MAKVDRQCAAPRCSNTFRVWRSEPKRYCSLTCRPGPGHRVPGPRPCETCGESYQPTSARQKYCPTCTSGKNATARIRRYGVTATEWTALLAKYDGLCWVCRTAEATCTDHDHESGAVRGALCRTCNMALHYVENGHWMARARAYLQGGDDDCGSA